MRIITGTARGKKLKTPAGLDTRPTTDRVKESIFNIIQFEVAQSRVLDLFAGSGQMGLEALSRGARSCTFVESDRESLAVIKDNISACGMEDIAEVEGTDVLNYIARCPKNAFDIILLDPPYGSELLNNALKSLCMFDILSDSGIILCEMNRDYKLDPISEKYTVLREYNYGKIRVATIKKA